MRFEELVLAAAGEEFRVHFHAHLTVLAGLAAEERADLLTSITGTMTGESEGTALLGVDHTGRPVRIESASGRVLARFTDDGSPAPAPIGWFATDADALRRLMVITPDDVGLGIRTEARDDDPPELAEARATLRQLGDERDAARTAHRDAESARTRLAELDDHLHRIEADSARRAYVAAAAALDRVRSEAAAVDSSLEVVAADRAALGEAEGLHRLADRWREAATRAEIARRATDGERIDETDLAWLRAVPSALPDDLQRLLGDAGIADAGVRTLEDRLRTLATATMPEPDDGRILTLATADQRELWAAFDRLAAARVAVDDEQIRVGGLGPQATPAAAIEALEAAHRLWEDVDRLVEDRRAPVVAGSAAVALLSLAAAPASIALGLALLVVAVVGAVAFLGRPMAARVAAAHAEKVALAPLGAPTFLAFNLRRVDATLDPAGRDGLELAQAELQLAERAWAAAAGDIEPEVAAELAIDVRAYAAALAAQQGAVEELAQLRRRLDTEAVPARNDARARLLAALEPYGMAAADLEGVTPQVVAAVAAARVELGERARAQLGIADAEADEAGAADLLGEVLGRLGHHDGSLADRFQAAVWAIEQASHREAARASARPREAIAAEQLRLKEEVRLLRRPEFATAEPSALDDLDPTALALERDQLRAALPGLQRAAADLDRVEDRHAAVQRRVGALQASHAGQGEAADQDVRHVQNAILGRLTEAVGAGPMDEPVPVLLDDALARIPAERKWELMDMLRRLGERTQVMYLTDDAFIGAWARRRAQVDQTITLLEPVD